MKQKRRSKNDYINNKTFYEKLIEFQDYRNDCLAKGMEEPSAPKYIAECIINICNGLGHKLNFINYTWRDEMISDGIEKCVAAINKFDRNRTNNPFAYFTRIAWNAFVSRINEEKWEIYLKHKSWDLIRDGSSDSSFDLSSHNKIIEDFEAKLEKKKNATRIDSAVDSDNPEP